MPTTVVLRRRGWTVEHVDDVRSTAIEHGYEDVGECDGRTFPIERLILIDSELMGVTKLETEIHEFGHALEDEWPEARVKVFARDLARALWRLGWRAPPRKAAS